MVKDFHNQTVVGSWSVSTLTFHGPAYEGRGHLLSLAAFPSTKYTPDALFFKAESTQKRSFWKSTILVPDGIWTHDLRIRSLAWSVICIYIVQYWYKYYYISP